MDIAGVTAVASLIGAVIGALTARNLRMLGYRNDGEVLLPQPVPVRWVLPVAVGATSILAAGSPLITLGH